PAPPPPLHSLPTRRSSDLVSPRFPLRLDCIGKTLKGFRRLPISRGRLRATIEGCRRGAEVSSVWAHSVVFPRLAWATRPKSVDQDRKSTRLNSSHVSISYA